MLAKVKQDRQAELFMIRHILGACILMGILSFTASARADTDILPEVEGGHREYRVKNLNDKIESENIKSFQLTLYEPQIYNPAQYEETSDEEREIRARKLELTKNEDGSLSVRAEGENMYAKGRDGSKFILDFKTDDRDYTRRLQQLVRKHNLSSNNGFVSHTDGLPSGDGDTLSVVYESGEKIYKTDNVDRIMSFEAAYDIYSLFRVMATDSKLDFTTAGSNVQLYDDPTVQWLQGRWSGKHFGQECLVEFEGNHIRIYYGGKLTDDTEYVIFEGAVKPAGKGAEEGKSASFNAFTGIYKQNSFTLDAHVYRNRSSSHVSLMRQKKK